MTNNFKKHESHIILKIHYSNKIKQVRNIKSIKINDTLNNLLIVKVKLFVYKLKIWAIYLNDLV